MISIGDEDDTVRECARAAPMSIQIAAGPGFNLRGWPGGGGYLGADILLDPACLRGWFCKHSYPPGAASLLSLLVDALLAFLPLL